MEEETDESFSPLFWVALIVGFIGLFGLIAVGSGVM
jgi:hypothetical protein